MKLSLRHSGILALALCAAGLHAQETPAPAKPAEKPAEIKDMAVIKVDGTPIYQTQIEDRMASLLPQQIANLPPEQAEVNRAQLRKEIVNELIGSVLMANAAQRKGIKATDEEVEITMKQMAATLVPNGTVETFLETTGLSRERFKSDIHHKILVQKLIEVETADLPVATEQEVKDFYQQNQEMFRVPETVRARHILVRTFGVFDEDELAGKRAKAESLRKKLLEDKTVDFATLAKQNSEDPGTAPNGGDLGQFARGDMEPEFERAAFSQEVGAIGEILKSNYGYHIIKVEAHDKERPLTFDEVKPWIGNKLLHDRRQAEMQKSLAEWHAAAKIEVLAPEAGVTPAAKAGQAPAPEAKP